MANPYDVERLAPEAYLNPVLFRTEYDGRNPERAANQFRQGKAIADEYDTVTIGCNGTWSASKGGSLLSSYERIGYHGDTSELLRGFLAGRAPLIVYRYSETGLPHRTVVKERTA